MGRNAMLTHDKYYEKRYLSMARERMVTRTVEETTVKVMAVKTDVGEVVTLELKLTGKVTADNALKLAKKHYENDTVCIAKVLSIDTKEVLYGMYEVDFIKYAKPMDSRFESLNK
jgi:hypothetical protein